MSKLRNLVLILGDQLDTASAAFDGFNSDQDRIWMAEAGGEATHVPSHKARIAIFLSAMRHFRDELRERNWPVEYQALDGEGNRGALGAQLAADAAALKPERLIVVEPGEWRVLQDIEAAAEDCGAPLEIRTDRHFLTTIAEFGEYAAGRKELRMEYFYRGLRKRFEVLMDGGKPAGGAWNFDRENRSSFGSGGPGGVPEPPVYPPDAVTAQVLELVERRFPDHPGSLSSFNWPVTRSQALAALDDFIRNRLPHFGRYQDAMWTGEPFLFHSRLSAALNLHLLNPREVIAAAEQAWRAGDAPLPAAEGFVRQILGWREYVRGIYWNYMPEYGERNALGADAALPTFFWDANTDMVCLRESIGQTLEHGYAHHIQRLMVTGLFALLLGVQPRQIHEWYLAIYVDAVEWVELPNVIGMSQFADGGLMASKPYAATGKYIQRMSNYCGGCRYNPAEPVGETACPFTTLYWDFLMRHEQRLAKNRRMQLQVRNLTRLGDQRKLAIRDQAAALRDRMGGV